MESAIITTLGYHDLFDYPLTQSEIKKFLIANSKFQMTNAKFKIQNLIKKRKIQKKNNFYFLTGRGKIIKTRQRRKKISQRKLIIAQRVSRYLRLIPSIKMIAVTGAIAIDNARKDDDIDFLIITSAERLWLTRILVVSLIELLGKRRRPQDLNPVDKICLNIFLDENHLGLPKNKRNLFTAHEIVQIKVIYQKDNLYQKFLKANQWLKKFLPNWKR